MTEGIGIASLCSLATLSGSSEGRFRKRTGPHAHAWRFHRAACVTGCGQTKTLARDGLLGEGQFDLYQQSWRGVRGAQVAFVKFDCAARDGEAQTYASALAVAILLHAVEGIE